MFRKFHEKRKNEEGFTLIELLVVILIIAILAAIAIPVFLRQREKGWVSQSESALKNAATAMESFATGNNGNYPAATDAAGTTAALRTEGYRPVNNVALRIALSGVSGYCLEADHALFPTGHEKEIHRYLSDEGRPVAAACPNALPT